MTIQAIEFGSAGEAIQHVNASGFGKAIMLDGLPMVTSEEDCHRLEVAGVEFVYLCDHKMPDGQSEKPIKQMAALYDSLIALHQLAR